MARRATRSITKKMLNGENDGQISVHHKNNGSDRRPTEMALDAEKIAQLIVDQLTKQHNIHLCKVVPDASSVGPKASSSSKEQDPNVTNKSERRSSVQHTTDPSSVSKERDSNLTNKSDRRNSLRNGRATEKSIPGESSIRRKTRAVSEGRVIHVSQRLAQTPMTCRRNLRSSSRMVDETFQRTEYICSRCKISWKQRDSKVSNYIFQRCNYNKKH
ncbi:hypothetical protein HA402_009014 [Bradysia odoriphaga]|nr:hypothetical protein HA402_009014 [Bradysia odoriphaga]